MIRDLTVSGNVEYSTDGGINWSTVTWPCTIQNSAVPTLGKVLFTTDILLNVNAMQYFTCNGSHIQFGDTSLTTSGTRPIITISGIFAYLGLIQNGTNLVPGNEYIYITNLKIVASNSSLQDYGGWVCQKNFAVGVLNNNNKVVHCTSDWTDNSSIGDSSGGIIGGYDGTSSGTVDVLYCYTSGNMVTGVNGLLTGVGGIFGAGTGLTTTVTATQCFSTGDIGYYSGGIFGFVTDQSTADKCYSTGAISDFAGGIYGTGSGITSVFATNCYSRGVTIGQHAGGIMGEPVFSGNYYLTASNCYSTGVIDGPNGGGGIIGTLSSATTVDHCYTSGSSSNNSGGIVAGTANDNANGMNNYGEANHGNSGIWNDSNAVGIVPADHLQGLGTVWFSLATDTPYILLGFGTSPYVLDNITPVSYDIVQTYSQTVHASASTIPAQAAGYGFFRILQGGHPTIVIDPVSGVITTAYNTPGGTYTLTIYGEAANPNDGYTTTTFLLTVIPPPPPPPPFVMTPACRFCYSYKPPGPIVSCPPPICTTDLHGSTICSAPPGPSCTTNATLSSLATLPDVVNNSSRTSEQSLLLAQQQMYLQGIVSTSVASTIQDTLQNSTSITSTLYGQLLQVRQDRFLPYRPYVPPMIPSSVIQLQMNTVNAGVPHSFFTIMDCKGSQSVTT